MSWIAYPLIAVAVFFLMEGITWCTHKYVMHGFLWWLHEDHHHPKHAHGFEKNDTFFLIFAIPAWLCIMLGSMQEAWWVVSIGAGITMYGVAYFLVHDVIIHQRFKWFNRSNNRYIKTIRWAHKMHHRHVGKNDGESFGLLYAAKKYWEKVKQDEEIRKKHVVNPAA
jgi:beta-carotene 3-hydroxylase